MTAAYAYGMSEKLSVGYSLGWTDDKTQSRAVFDYPMGNGFRHTLGAIYKINNEFTIGDFIYIGHGTHSALYGPGITRDANTFEFGYDIGTTYRMNQQTSFSLGLDYRHLHVDGDVDVSLPQNFVGGDENGNIFNIRTGIEHQLYDWLLVRAGYRFAGLATYNYNRTELNELNGSAYYNAFTLGFGLVFPLSSQYFKSINIDYGAEYRAVGRDDWQQVLSLVLPFNPCRA